MIRRIPIRALRKFSRPLLIVGASVLSVSGVAAAIWISSSRGPAADTPTQKLVSPCGPLSCVLYGPVGKDLAAGAPSGDVVVWGLPSDEPEVLKQVSRAPITTLAMSSAGLLLAGTTERSLVGWQLSGTKKDTLKVPKFPAPVSASAVHPMRFDVAVGLSDGSIYVFAENQKPRRIDSRHAGGVKSICYHPDGDHFVTAGTDGRLIWRNADSLRIQNAIRSHSNEVCGLTFSDDGQLLASGDYDGRIIVRAAATTEQRFRLRQPDAVSGMAIVGSRLITGSWDGWIRIWSLETKSIVEDINTGRAIHGMTLDSERTTIATVHNTNEVLVWNLPDE